MKETKGAGSHTRTQLKKLKRKFKIGKLKVPGLSGPTLSRALAGRKRPSRETIWKIVAALDPVSGSQLMSAYLADDIPKDLRTRICISMREDVSDTCRCWNPLVQKILALKPDLAASVERIVDELLNPSSPDTPVINLSSLAKIFRPGEG